MVKIISPELAFTPIFRAVVRKRDGPTILQCCLLVGLLDLLRGCSGGNAQQFVVVYSLGLFQLQFGLLQGLSNASHVRRQILDLFALRGSDSESQRFHRGKFGLNDVTQDSRLMPHADEETKSHPTPDDLIVIDNTCVLRKRQEES